MRDLYKTQQKQIKREINKGSNAISDKITLFKGVKTIPITPLTIILR